MTTISKAALGGSVLALCSACLFGSAPSVNASPAVDVTVRASSTSTQYDEPVTFTIEVSVNGSPGQGFVTIEDASTGTALIQLDPLASGTVSFTSAALAPGARRIEAVYQYGADVFTSRAASVQVAAVADATAYHNDAAHDGDQVVGRLKAPDLKKAWSIDLGHPSGTGTSEDGDVSYPIVAGGRVFVSVQNAGSNGHGNVVDALDAATGQLLWTVPFPGADDFSGLTYDGRQLFVLDSSGNLTDLDPVTGRSLWVTSVGEQTTAPPTAYDGLVYFAGASVGGEVFAVNESDGQIQWRAPLDGGDASSPAVGTDGVYLSYAGPEVYGFTHAGSLLWNFGDGSSGGGGATPAIYQNRVYAQPSLDDNQPGIELNPRTGKTLGSYSSFVPPTFSKASVLAWQQTGDVIAESPSNDSPQWEFSTGATIAPAVDGNVVFVARPDGNVYGLAASDGTPVWSGRAGPAIDSTEPASVQVWIGMAVGDGELVVPAGTLLTAFADQ